MSEPVISVVVPVYNAMNTLPDCVGSILSQKVEGLEVILVDDGSTDKSGSICDAFAQLDDRVQVVHQADGGVSAARNAGLRLVRGKYVAFLDSDDHLLPDALQTALDAQAAHPGAWVLWRYSTGDAAEQFKGGETLQDIDRLAGVYLDCLLSMPWNKLYRARTAKEVLFDERYTLGEDLLFCLAYRQALGISRLCIVEKPLTFYNCGQSDGTLSTRYLPDYCAVWESIYDKLNEACTECGCPEKDMDALYRTELRVLAEGAADILARDPAPTGERRRKAAAALATPWVQAHLKRMRDEQVYSPYYLPVKHGNAARCAKLWKSRLQNTPYYGHMDWLYYYLLGGGWKRG